MIGRIKNAPEGTEDFYGSKVEYLKDDFEKYIDELEKAHKIYEQLMGY